MQFFLFFLVTFILTAVSTLIFKMGLACYIDGFALDNIYTCLKGIRYDIAVSCIVVAPFLLVGYLYTRIKK